MRADVAACNGALARCVLALLVQLTRGSLLLALGWKASLPSLTASAMMAST